MLAVHTKRDLSTLSYTTNLERKALTRPVVERHTKCILVAKRSVSYEASYTTNLERKARAHK